MSLRVAVAVAVAVALVPLLGTPPASAVPDAPLPGGAVAIEQDATGTTISLVASTPQLDLVRQESARQDRTLAGDAGTMTALPAGPEYLEAVGGTVYGLSHGVDPGTFEQTTSLVGLTPSTGETTSTPVPGGVQYLGVTAHGWLGLRDGILTLHGASERVLRRDLGVVWKVAAFADHAALTVSDGSGLRTVLHLDLLAGTSDVVEETESWVGELAVGATDLAWVTDDPTGRQQVARRRLGGGEVTRLDVSDRVLGLGVADGAVAWTTSRGDGYGIVVLPDGGAPVDVPLAGASASLRGVGTGFRAAVSGPLEVAGIYSVAADGGTARIRTVPAPSTAWAGVDLAAGTVYVSDGASSADAHRVWRRAVLGTAEMVLGEQTPVGLPVERDLAPRFSAGRGVLGAGVGADLREVYTVLDRGRVVGRVSPSLPYNLFSVTPVQLSGPYLVLGGEIVRVDGRRLEVVGAAGWPFVFGPLLASPRAGGGVLLHDLSRPAGADRPTVIQDRCPSTSWCRLVGLGGDSVAWLDADGGLTVHDLRTGRDRTVPRRSGVTWPTKVRVDVGAVVWEENAYGTSSVYALDTTDPTTGPVLLTTTASLVDLALDDGRVAWVTSRGEAVVAPLPFDRPRPPRLLGVVGAGLSPDGNGRADRWTPQIDLTKPVRDVTVTVWRNGSVVRVLRGTAPDGSVRDVSWDGRDTLGDLVPDGVYGWTLSGRATDGDGAVRAVGGVRPASGTVVVDRAGPATTVKVPAVALGRSGGTVPVWWRPTADAASTQPSRYDVRVRTVTTTRTGRLRFGPVERWLTRTAGRSGRYPIDVRPGLTYQFSARTLDELGNLGPWSPWATTTVPHDDRALAVTGGWTRTSDPEAFGGGRGRADDLLLQGCLALRGLRRGGAGGGQACSCVLRRPPGGDAGLRHVAGVESGRRPQGRRRTLTTTSREGGWLDLPPVWGSAVTVHGRLCDACGELQIWVDGVLRGRVNTYGGSEGPPDLLWRKVLPFGRHTVRLLSVRAYGRTGNVVDAVTVGPR